MSDPTYPKQRFINRTVKGLRALVGLMVMGRLFGVFGIAQDFEGPPSGSGLAPKKGIFLIAPQTMQDPRFRQSVILLVTHNQDGTMGLIINRVTPHLLSSALPDLESAGQRAHRLHFGGPVGLRGLMFLTRSPQPPEEVAPVVGNIYFGGNRKILEKLVGEKIGPEQLRVYMGYSGWAPGQLESEIEKGSWYLVRADERSVFEKDPEDVWGDLIGPLLRRRYMAGFLPSVAPAGVSVRDSRGLPVGASRLPLGFSLQVPNPILLSILGSYGSH